MLKLVEFRNYQSSHVSILSGIATTPLTNSLVECELWIEVNRYHYLPCPFKVRDYNTKNGTIKWHSIRRQKREWIKFAAACREGEDNSKRNPIAKVSLNPTT